MCTNTTAKTQPRICPLSEAADFIGRVGRSAAAKTLDEEAVRLAVTAHVRHAETNYDDLLLKGIERREARENVYSKVSKILDRWKHSGS
jgi:hypothetical protein